jgi:hypothetical protein
VWALLRAAPPAVLQKISNLYDEIKVRCLDGVWRNRHQALLPGRIVSPEEQKALAELTVDMDTHKADVPALTGLGISDVPRAMLQPFGRYNAPVGYADVMRGSISGVPRKRTQIQREDASLLTAEECHVWTAPAVQGKRI